MKKQLKIQLYDLSSSNTQIHSSYFVKILFFFQVILLSPLIYSNSDLEVRAQNIIHKSTHLLLKEQLNTGAWDYPSYLGSQYISQYIIFMKWLELPLQSFDEKKYFQILLNEQLNDGSWPGIRDENHVIGNLDATILNYWALKILDPKQEQFSLNKTRSWINNNGGLEHSTALVKALLALYGEVSWDFLPKIPKFIFSKKSPLSEKDFAQWIGPHLLPIAYLRNFNISKKNPVSLDEIRIQTKESIKKFASDKLKSKKSITLIKKIISSQQPKGTWGGYTVASLFSLCALKSFNEAHVQFNTEITLATTKSLKQIHSFYFGNHKGAYKGVLDDGHYWDTALVLHALIETQQALPAQKNAIQYLKNAQTHNGGIPFGYDFEYAPDTDDTALVISAWIKSEGLSENTKNALSFLEKMQNKDGGWGAFSKNNRHRPLLAWFARNLQDGADLFDESSPDVTGHILEAFGLAGYTFKNSITVKKATKYLLKMQNKNEGYWSSRWGINTLNGTSAAIIGLLKSGMDKNSEAIQKGLKFLLSHQNQDGGFGESTLSYVDKNWIAKGISTPTQTSWVLLALLEANLKNDLRIKNAVKYLLNFYETHENWYDPSVVGTGHPQIIYMVYPSYPKTFPLMALGKYIYSN